MRSPPGRNLFEQNLIIKVHRLVKVDSLIT